MPSMSWQSWRFPGVRRLARLSRTAFAFMLAVPLALLALAPLAGPVAAHPAPADALATGKVASPAVDLTLHYRSILSGGVTPTLLATDAAGNLYVSDMLAQQVEMYDANDAPVRAFGNGGAGSGNGSFTVPVGVVVTGGTVYVADNGNNRIQTFNQSTGAYISKFGSADLSGPNGLALGSNGTLYVADSGNNRIDEFDTSGNYLGSFGAFGSGTGQLSTPIGIAFNATNGDLYVADNGNKRVEVFTLAGAYVTQWGSASFLSPAGVAVDRAGMVYVADAGAATIYKFDPSGSLVGSYAAPVGTAAAPGNLVKPTGVAVRSVANQPLAVYVGDEDTVPGTGYVDRFDQVLDPQVHTYQSEWSAAGGDFLNGPASVAVDPSGNVYVVDRGNNKVYKFDQFGNFLLAFGGYGSSPGQFTAPSGIAVSPNGSTVYVADTNNSRIEAFDSSGNYLSTIGSFGSGDGNLSGPFALATDGTYLYVADTGNNRIEVFDPSGVFISEFGTSATMSNPSGIAVDIARKELFITDQGYNRIDVYTIGGTNVGSLTTVAGLNFNEPEQVSTDQRGDVYVADYFNSRIVEFDVNLTRAIAFGVNGSNPGQFDTPFGVAVSPTNGQIYMADYGNNVVQRWGSPWPKNDTVGIYRPSTKTFYLRNENSTGPADISVYMPYAQAGDLPVVGDWNGDGVDTVGLYRPSKARFLLQDSNTQESTPDYVFTLGINGDTPIAGDWSGDGFDGAGIFRPSNGILYLKNSLSTGVADYTLVLGKPEDVGIAGDWNGDGQDSPGVYRPSTQRFFVTNKVTNGVVTSDHSAVLGISGDAPFTGDWIAQGFSGIGVFRPTNGITYEKNVISTGPADNQFTYGIAGDIPVAGQWVEPSVPFSAPAPHISLGTRAGSSAPYAPSGGWHGWPVTPAPSHPVSTSHASAATTPRRATPR